MTITTRTRPRASALDAEIAATEAEIAKWARSSMESSLASHVHDIGGWERWVVGEPGAPDAEAVARAEAEAARRLTACHESFERCDTDGFLTQWAARITADMHRTIATVAAEGHRARFPGLYEIATGRRVRAKLIPGRFNWCWAYCDATGKFTGEFVADARGPRAALRKRGLVVIAEYAPAAVEIASNGTGLSACAASHVRTYRTDGGYPPDAT
jgi:hypothetical protein